MITRRMLTKLSLPLTDDLLNAASSRLKDPQDGNILPPGVVVDDVLYPFPESNHRDPISLLQVGRSDFSLEY